MQALFDLVHSLAKEEKRLYNLHGRKSRFTHIYRGYLSVTEYNKNLDRQIYSKHFSSFSKAFYSMQKNALLDDILAVLLEYSNSSREDFIVNRYKAKYEVLKYKGFHEQAQNYIRAALDACGKINSPRLRLRILEDYRDTLAKSKNTSWEEYSEILSRIETTSAMVSEVAPFEENLKKINVLVSSSQTHADADVPYREITEDILHKITEYAQEHENPENRKAAFDSEYLYSKTFEDKYELHKRLAKLEKISVKEDYPRDIRLQIVNLLMESGMETGDFLLISGLIYKTDKSLTNLTPAQKHNFLPRYLELCSVYYFYENDLQLSQRRINRLLEIEGLTDEQYIRFFVHKIGILLAANLPRSAAETLEELLGRYTSLKQEIFIRLIDLILSIEMNQREEALVKLQRLRSHIRKSKDSRKLSHYRAFLEKVQKLLNKKNLQYAVIPALETDWMDLIKLNLWVKAKIENQFYYNNILTYWQDRKTVIRV